MAMNKTFFVLAVCLAASLGFSACGANPGSDDSSIHVVSVKAKALISPYATDPSATARAAAAGANDFAFSLSKALVKETGNDNFVCSPFSVWLPLAALANATKDEYKPGLLTALGADGLGATDLNMAASRMMYDLTGAQRQNEKGYYNPLKIANAIFVGNNVTLRKEFAQTYMDYFRGSSINVDFHSHNAVDAVNRWASKNTNGKIKDIIKQFNPDTVAAIANAIYFSDKWSWEFDSNDTKKDVFYAPSGESTAYYMLRDGGGQWYYEDENVQVVPLAFETGAVMYILLPISGGAADFLASMTSAYFNDIQKNLVLAKGKLLLPRFSIESSIDDNLKEALVSLGIPLFDPTASPLNGLINEKALYATKAEQKALIQVDERGTTAAAATVIEMGNTSPGLPKPPETPFTMICNKPFVFILCGHTCDGGNQILFTGVVNQP